MWIADDSDAFTSNYVPSANISYSFSAIDTLILSIAQVFLFIYGGHQVVAGKLSVGNFTIISSYFALMMTSVRYFFSLGKSVQETRSDCYILQKRFESSCTIDKHCSGIIAPFLVYIGRSLLFSKYLCPYMCPTVDSM